MGNFRAIDMEMDFAAQAQLREAQPVKKGLEISSCTYPFWHTPYHFLKIPKLSLFWIWKSRTK